MAIPTKLIDRAIRRSGEPVWLFPSNGSFTETRGIFQEVSDEDSLQGVPARSDVLTLLVPTKDAEGMEIDDRLIVSETEYRAQRIERVRQGTTIQLRNTREE